MYYNFNPNLAEPLNVIHPLQLKAVQKVLSSEIPKAIDYIYLFGSSLELACGIHSDIDLMLITEDADHDRVYGDFKSICRDAGRTFDILISDKAGFLQKINEIGSVANRMKERGVLYAKG
jgi:predicted nucleotidyltransferase